MLARLLLLLITAALATGEERWFYSGPTTLADAITAMSFTDINATGVTYTCLTGTFDPYNKVIRYPNQRRQRPVVVNGVTHQADLIEQSATNLLAAGTSSYFTIGWTTGTGVPTVTDAATTGVAGDTDAASFIEGTTNGEQSIRQSITKAASSLDYVGSVFIKNVSGSRDVVVELDDGTTTNGVSMRVNPATGVIDANPAAFGSGWATQSTALANSGKVDSFGSGWYKVSLIATSDTTTTVRFRVALYNASTSYAGDGTSGVDLWAADVKQARYVSTISDNRNVLARSEDWSGSWTGLNISQSAAAAANPLAGDTTATSITDNSTNAAHSYRQSFTKAASSQTFTFTAYGKANTLSWLVLKCAGTTGSANSAGAYFDLTNGVTGSNLTTGAGWSISSKSITSAGSGWYRCKITITTASESLIVSFIGTASADATQSYAGSSQSEYIYGSQLQYGSAATTYWATNLTGSGARGAPLLTSTATPATTRGTILAWMIPYGWTGHFNNSTVYRIVSSATTAADCELRAASGAGNNALTFSRTDSLAVTKAAAVTASPALTDGTLTLFGMSWDSVVRAVQNGAFNAVTGSGTPPWVTQTSMAIGPITASTLQPNAYVFAEVSPFVVPDGYQSLIYAATTTP